MDNEFKFRVLTGRDWKKVTTNGLTVREDGGLELEGCDGSYISKPLDSGIKDCRWHRIVLDADIPENSTLTISFYSSESEETAKTWNEGEDPVTFKNTRDALVQVPSGRYIRLKIEFHREGKESPVLRQVMVYYPRLSYLRYLPAVYQEDATSREFLERFLSIFESALHNSEEEISRIHRYFDPMATRKDFVKWLASWVSLDLHELSGDRNREFILRAAELYKKKGTMSGILTLVSFLTGIERERCCVKEYMNNVFRTCRTEQRGVVGGIADECCRKISETVDTADPDLLANMGTYSDDVHYTTDTSEDGRYARNVIGLFIFLPEGEGLLIKEDGLYRMIDSFLPVFVRAKIIVVEVPVKEMYGTNRIIEEYENRTHRFLEEGFKDLEGVYRDCVDWNWLCAYKDAYNGHTNDPRYRTPHGGIGMEIAL